MKAKYLVIALLIAVLALGGMGCVGEAKTTGGGQFTNTALGQPASKITFGFNAEASIEDGTTKGQFQLIDHDTKTRIHGSFEGESSIEGFTGTCTINGEGSYPFVLSVVDAGEPGSAAGDLVNVWINGTLMYSGYLEGGNIQYHPAKPEKG